MPFSATTALSRRLWRVSLWTRTAPGTDAACAMTCVRSRRRP